MEESTLIPQDKAPAPLPVGSVVLYDAGNGVKFRMEILEVTRPFGKYTYRCRPLDGIGEAWLRTLEEDVTL